MNSRDPMHTMSGTSFEITATRAVLGLVVAILVSGGAGWMTYMQSKVSSLEAMLITKSERFEAALSTRAEQQARLETRVDEMKNVLANMTSQLTRIEAKVDDARVNATSRQRSKD